MVSFAPFSSLFYVYVFFGVKLMVKFIYTHLICDGCVFQYAAAAIDTEAFAAHVKRFAWIIEFPAKGSAGSSNKLNKLNLLKYLTRFINLIC